MTGTASETGSENESANASVSACVSETVNETGEIGKAAGLRQWYSLFLRSKRLQAVLKFIRGAPMKTSPEPRMPKSSKPLNILASAFGFPWVRGSGIGSIAQSTATALYRNGAPQLKTPGSQPVNLGTYQALKNLKPRTIELWSSTLEPSALKPSPSRLTLAEPTPCFCWALCDTQGRTAIARLPKSPESAREKDPGSEGRLGFHWVPPKCSKAEGGFWKTSGFKCRGTVCSFWFRVSGCWGVEFGNLRIRGFIVCKLIGVGFRRRG